MPVKLLTPTEIKIEGVADPVQVRGKTLYLTYKRHKLTADTVEDMRRAVEEVDLKLAEREAERAEAAQRKAMAQKIDDVPIPVEEAEPVPVPQPGTWYKGKDHFESIMVRGVSGRKARWSAGNKLLITASHDRKLEAEGRSVLRRLTTDEITELRSLVSEADVARKAAEKLGLSDRDVKWRLDVEISPVLDGDLWIATLPNGKQVSGKMLNTVAKEAEKELVAYTYPWMSDKESGEDSYSVKPTPVEDYLNYGARLFKTKAEADTRCRILNRALAAEAKHARLIRSYAFDPETLYPKVSA